MKKNFYLLFYIINSHNNSMEKLISIEKYIEMGKVKLVPVDQAPEQEQPTPVEPVVEPVAEPVAEILAIEPPVIAEAKPKKEQANVTCENCGKSMLMKTYKYSHLKLCKPAIPEPPPPPEPKVAPLKNNKRETQLSKQKSTH